MAKSRKEQIEEMLADEPNDPFLRYGLAMEYKNAGDLESAMREFQTLMDANPDYCATYFHAGQTLERIGRAEEARAVYEKGIEVTTRKGDEHARSELQGALDLL